MSTAECELLHLTVDIWHPSCWTLETTREADGGLYTHTTTATGEGTIGVVTLYGPSRETLDALTSTIGESPLTGSIEVLDRGSAGAVQRGSTTRSVLVGFDPGPSIREGFTDRGFVHYGPTRHENGRERRSLLIRANRETAGRRIERIEREYDADIELVRIASVAGDTGAAPTGQLRATLPGEGLSPRQRDAFGLARSRGYYEYPRETTAGELAAELDISKATFLEHLRKAESKLLADVDPR